MGENYRDSNARLDERCGRICKGKTCFAADDDHRACITDMLINKIWPVKRFIENALSENRCSHIAGILEMADSEMEELLSFAKRLQDDQRRRETAHYDAYGKSTPSL